MVYQNLRRGSYESAQSTYRPWNTTHHCWFTYAITQLLFSPSSLFSQIETWTDSKLHLPVMVALPKSQLWVLKSSTVAHGLVPPSFLSKVRAQYGDSHGSNLLRKEKVREGGLRKGSRGRVWSQLESSLIWSHRELWSLDCTRELPPSLFEAKGPFVLLSQSVFGYEPRPGAEELLNFPDNSRLGNSHLAKGNSLEKEAAVSH